MKKIILGTTVSLALAASSQAFAGDVTTSVGMDYSSGKYGTSETTNTWNIPLLIKYESAPVTFKLTIPYVHSTGTVNRDTGIAVQAVRHTDEGLGDIVAFGAYNVLDGRGATVGLDLAGKIKFATAEKSKTLLTTGKNDYSLQADLFKAFGTFTGFATLGATEKGDPNGIDFKNPWYATLGGSYKISNVTSVGALYDYRSKLLDTSDNISEMTFFVTNKLTTQWKLQGYVVTGFSDASPDWAVGGLVSYAY